MRRTPGRCSSEGVDSGRNKSDSVASSVGESSDGGVSSEDSAIGVAGSSPEMSGCCQRKKRQPARSQRQTMKERRIKSLVPIGEFEVVNSEREHQWRGREFRSGWGRVFQLRRRVNPREWWRSRNPSRTAGIAELNSCDDRRERSIYLETGRVGGVEWRKLSICYFPPVVPASEHIALFRREKVDDFPRDSDHVKSKSL